jgi:magnesium chelatase family protein
VAIVRARHSAVYPARFMLVAATNPCPCGFAGERERCACSEADLARHRRRLSGPLLDRIDLLVHVERTAADHLTDEPAMSSAQAREQVIEARLRQARRLRAEGILVNAQMDAQMLRRHLKLDEQGELRMAHTRKRGLLSARGQHRALRVARTLADLQGRERVGSEQILQALTLRPETGLSERRAA